MTLVRRLATSSALAKWKHDSGFPRAVVNVARTGVALGELAWISLSRSYRAFWWDSRSNFGDLITEAVVRWLGARRVVNVRGFPLDCGPALVGAGSILWMLQYPSGIVWGSGFLCDQRLPTEKEPQMPLDVLAFRGPRSRDIAKTLGWKTPAVFGDPGLFMSRMFEPGQKRYEAGFIPHYSHAHSYGGESTNRVKVIDVAQSVRAIAAEVSSCRAVVSTSLHGIVAAHSFGIPWVWCKMEPSLGGDEFKFLDFMEGMRISARPVVLSAEEVDEASILAVAREARLPDGVDVPETQRQLLQALRGCGALQRLRLADKRMYGME